jgi:signal transduction histidine kinase
VGQVLTQISSSFKENNPGTYSVLQSMVNYLFVVDFRGTIRLVSQSLIEDTGREQNFYEGKNIKNILIDERSQYNLISQFLIGRPASEIELHLKHKDDSIIPILMLSTTQLKDFFNGEDYVLVLCSDLRLQKQAQATLLESNKMASLGEMSSSMAHELNNPLTIMEGQLRRLEDYLQDDDISTEESIKLVNKVQRNLGRAVKIIKSFRSISRKGDNDPIIPVPLKQLVEEIQELTQKRLENHHINLSIIYDNINIDVPCRISSLLQVFINLISNAVDALENCTDKWIKLHIIKQQNNIIFTVMDSGQGVSVENQIRLFEPFFTTKEIGKGTGLGLSISKSIIEEHGGTLVYTNNFSNSCFIITLPFK